jgi:hypothetical protein
MPSSGSTPTATPTPRPSWTTTVGWSPSWRSQAARPAHSGCSAWSPSELLGVAAGCWRGPAATAPGWPASCSPRASGSWRSTGPSGPRGRNGAKSDPLDAIRAGREALSRDHLACPRQRGHREALRVLQLTRSGAVKVAADARRQLKALLVTAARPARRRPGHRRASADQLVAPGPAALGGGVRDAGWRRPHRGILGAGGPLPAEPRR